MKTIYLIPCIFLALASSISSSTNKLNSLPKTSNGRTKNAIVATGTAAALTAFKFLNDGPIFNEPISLAGKDIAITGGNTGLGKESAVKLASLGARVIILSRASLKTEDAVKEIKQRSGSSAVDFIPLDLADLSSVRSCASTLRAKLSKLDVLMNNAGVMAIPERQVTRDGFEMQLGVNHLGHFLLTNELMAMLKKAPSGRVVNVSSNAHLFSKLQEADLQLQQPGAYQPWVAYGNTKLANILFTKKLAEELRRAGSSVIALVCHPGACRTELGRFIFDPSSVPAYARPLLTIPLLPAVYLTKSATQGSQTQTFLAASDKITQADSGKYFDNSREATPGATALVTSDGEWLWRQSETLTGKPFSV